MLLLLDRHVLQINVLRLLVVHEVRRSHVGALAKDVVRLGCHLEDVLHLSFLPLLLLNLLLLLLLVHLSLVLLPLCPYDPLSLILLSDCLIKHSPLL